MENYIIILLLVILGILIYSQSNELFGGLNVPDNKNNKSGIRISNKCSDIIQNNGELDIIHTPIELNDSKKNSNRNHMSSIPDRIRYIYGEDDQYHIDMEDDKCIGYIDNSLYDNNKEGHPSTSGEQDDIPSEGPTGEPNEIPGYEPGEGPSGMPGEGPSEGPSGMPGEGPSGMPGEGPGEGPSGMPGEGPGEGPSGIPDDGPGEGPSGIPDDGPSGMPGEGPSEGPSGIPDEVPDYPGTDIPSSNYTCTSYASESEANDGSNCIIYDKENVCCGGIYGNCIQKDKKYTLGNTQNNKCVPISSNPCQVYDNELLSGWQTGHWESGGTGGGMVLADDPQWNLYQSGNSVDYCPPTSCYNSKYRDSCLLNPEYRYYPCNEESSGSGSCYINTNTQECSQNNNNIDGETIIGKLRDGKCYQQLYWDGIGN